MREKLMEKFREFKVPVMVASHILYLFDENAKLDNFNPNIYMDLVENWEKYKSLDYVIYDQEGVCSKCGEKATQAMKLITELGCSGVDCLCEQHMFNAVGNADFFIKAVQWTG